jgi:DNA-binding CsgD family transcriptional regulator
MSASGERLIEAIYGAALDDSGWDAALMLLADFVGADDAGLGAACAGQIPWLAAPRTDPERLAAYGAYGADDIVWQRIVGLGPGAVACDGMVAREDELRGNRFQQEWSLPQGYRHKLGAFVGSDDGWMSVLVCPSRSPFDKEDKDKLAALAPHLRRALLIGRQLGRLEGMAEIAERAVADPLRPALVLDGAGRVLLAGPAAEPWFAEGLRIAERQIDLPGAEGERLRAMLAGHSPASAAPGDEVRLPSGRRLRVLLLGLAAARRGPGQPAAIVTGIPLMHEEQVSLLIYRYRLTAAEARLAIEMQRGDGRHAAAARRGIAYATARTHLSRIFDKLGVARQGELVAVLDRVLG